MSKQLRIGAVCYLNAKPLIHRLAERLPEAEVIVEAPSRLARDLAEGALDVAMIPSVEFFRGDGYRIISDACIACDGPVLSVKLFGRVPPSEIKTLALDEGSRTSVALTKILLRERFGVTPATCELPLDAEINAVEADATLLIGDRGITRPAGDFNFVWDLGEEWTRWTGLPFVFALWIARKDLPPDDGSLVAGLSAARDDGVNRLEEIATAEAAKIGISQEEALTYLRDHLKFGFGERQKAGLSRFFELAKKNSLLPSSATFEI